MRVAPFSSHKYSKDSTLAIKSNYIRAPIALLQLTHKGRGSIPTVASTESQKLLLPKYSLVTKWVYLQEKQTAAPSLWLQISGSENFSRDEGSP